jgi:hypothetical protein
MPFRNLSSMPVERGVLFSAPCLDPQLRQALFTSQQATETTQSSTRGFLFTEPGLDPAVRVAYDQWQWPLLGFSSTSATKVEKGLLFSAPCLDFDRDGQEKHV